MPTAYSKPIQVNSWEAAADLSTKQFFAVKLNGSTKLALCGAGEAAIGIAQATIGAFGTGKKQMLDVITCGISKAFAGAAFGDGDLLAADAAGKLVKATPGAAIVGMALDDASGADVLAPVLVFGGGGAPAVGMFTMTAGAEAGNVIKVTAQLKNMSNGANIAAATRYAAHSNDAGATLTDGGNGTVDFGSGTVDIEGTTDATGSAQIDVSDVAAESVVLRITPDKGVTTFITITFV